MYKSIIILPIIILFFILQIFLSLRKNKFYGLIIPAIIFVTTSMSFMFMIDDGQGLLGSAIGMYSPFLLTMIIYFICRGIYKGNHSDRTQSEMDKMTINDL